MIADIFLIVMFLGVPLFIVVTIIISVVLTILVAFNVQWAIELRDRMAPRFGVIHKRDRNIFKK